MTTKTKMVSAISQKPVARSGPRVSLRERMNQSAALERVLPQAQTQQVEAAFQSCI